MPQRDIIQLSGITQPQLSSGSLIVTFNELPYDFGSPYIQVIKNNRITKIQYTNIDNLYSTFLNIGDTVSVARTFDSNEYLTVNRLDYTSDDENGDMGIKQSYITSGSTTGVTFTVTGNSNSYNFEYVVSNEISIPTPTPTSTPTPTPTGTPTPTPTPTGTPTPTPTPPIPSNLVLNLDAGNPSSYPTTGTTWYDLSGSGHTTTLINGPTYSSSNGGSIVFDGINDYANILRTGLTFGSNFTWNMWFKTDKTTDNQRIFMNWTSNEGVFPVYNYIFVWQINNGKIDGNIRNTDGVDILPSYTGATISANTIYNLVITWEASTKTAKIYLNGSLNQTLVSVRTNVNIATPTSTNMTLAQSDSSSYLDGNIYNIQAYSKTLTATEVSNLYSYYVTRYS